MLKAFVSPVHVMNVLDVMYNVFPFQGPEDFVNKLLSCPASGEEDKCRVVHQHLPTKCLQGLDSTPSKHRHPLPHVQLVTDPLYAQD